MSSKDRRVHDCGWNGQWVTREGRNGFETGNAGFRALGFKPLRLRIGGGGAWAKVLCHVSTNHWVFMSLLSPGVGAKQICTIVLYCRIFHIWLLFIQNYIDNLNKKNVWRLKTQTTLDFDFIPNFKRHWQAPLKCVFENKESLLLFKIFMKTKICTFVGILIPFSHFHLVFPSLVISLKVNLKN